ncbi:MAG: DNA repair protein RecN [Parvularculales bacterium]
MLASLFIRDIVLIDSLNLGLGRGLCALTGETGAGKSILLDALGLALGGRADSGLVRMGAKQGSVTASFEVFPDHPACRLLRERDMECEGVLVLRRTQTGDGRTRAFVNDQPVSVSLLRLLGALLVEVHGQYDTLSLLDEASQRRMLDAYGEYVPLLEEVRVAYEARYEARVALEAYEAEASHLTGEVDYLEHSVNELTALNPKVGEEKELAGTREFLRQGAAVTSFLSQALDILGQDNNLENSLGSVVRHLERLVPEGGGQLNEIIETLDKLLAEMEDARHVVTAIVERLADKSSELEEVEQRLFALREAGRKYNIQPDELADLLEKFQTRLRSTEVQVDRGCELAACLDKAVAAYTQSAEVLSKARIKVAGRLDKEVCQEFEPLKLGGAIFVTRVERPENLDETRDGGVEGWDRVYFEVAPNTDLSLGPLNRIASGGELSRFMLALKVTLANRGVMPVMVFDEIDQGIGGAVADAVGQRLARLAQKTQVLVVTHAPQVAARADKHFSISKEQNDMTLTSVRVVCLSEDDRLEEIARMLAGARVTEEARAAAKRLLKERLS